MIRRNVFSLATSPLPGCYVMAEGEVRDADMRPHWPILVWEGR